MTELGARYEIEVWAGAEDHKGGIGPTRRQSIRQLVSQFQTSEEGFFTDAFHTTFKESLQRATKVALELGPFDLTENYLPPRSAHLG